MRAAGSAFAIAAAQECKGIVVTGDPEFAPLQRAGVVKVDWIARR
ncbi:MAG: hypothetical protein U1E76_06990 [Planctomycetota bacterium]